MKPPETNDPLDVLLREQNPHVDDAGFTARVVSTLPRRRARFPLRAVLLLGAALVGSVIAAFFLPWSSLPPLSASAMFSLDTRVLWPWLLVVMVVVSLSWAAVVAIQSED
jgi:hypothetical protein